MPKLDLDGESLMAKLAEMTEMTELGEVLSPCDVLSLRGTVCRLSRIYTYVCGPCWNLVNTANMAISVNRSKRSVCIDLGNPRGIEIAYELVRHADVLVENFSPGVLERRGLGYAKLAEINPRLIMCSISGYGQTGPYANWPGTDPVAPPLLGDDNRRNWQQPVAGSGNLSVD